MDIIRTDFDARFHTKICCCCFSLKTGSTLIAVLNLICLCISTILLFSLSEVEIDENSDVDIETVEDKMSAKRVAKVIINILTMSLSGLMLWGNIKGDKKLMLPYVYVGLVGLIFLAVVEVVMDLTLICVGEFFAAFISFLVMSIIILLELYYWEVVRCRVLELDQLEQPRSSYPQQDPELPAYEDIQSTTAMNMAEQEKSPLAYPNDQINYE